MIKAKLEVNKLHPTQTLFHLIDNRRRVKDVYRSFGYLRNKLGIDSPFLFSSKPLDTEIGLYYYINRYYDPDTGRFITQDPLLFVINPYIYPNNDPINFIDPYGLCGERRGSWWKKALKWWWYNIFEPPYNTLTQPGYNYGLWIWGEKNLRNFYGACLDAIWLIVGISNAINFAKATYNPTFYQYYGPKSSPNSPWLTRTKYTVDTAMEKLSAPTEWTSVRRVNVPWEKFVGGPRIAAPKFGKPGGGIEYRIEGFGFKNWIEYFIDWIKAFIGRNK